MPTRSYSVNKWCEVLSCLKPYPAMKDSGVEWLGAVPEHWQVLPNRALFDEIKQRNCPDEEMLSVTIKRGVIRQAALLENSSKKDSSNLDRSHYKLVQPVDIAYNKMRAWQGAIGVSDYRGIVSPAYVIQRPRKAAMPRYFHQLFRIPAFAKEAERWSYGITSDMWSLRPEHFKLIYSCLPPMAEQAAIVKYLDYVDRRVRRLVRAKRKLIALLTEQKQAIIHRAVTRGLHPDMPMKESGVEWIGEVPAHWGIFSLGAVVHSIQTGPFGSQLHADEYVAGGVPVINPSHMCGGRIHSDHSIAVSRSKAEELARHMLRAGDVVAARRGELGRCALVTDSEKGWLCGTGSLRIRPKNDVFESSYLVRLLSSQGVRDSLSLSSIGATMDNLNAGMVSRLRLPVPAVEDQREIIRSIASSSKAIGSAIDLANREIDLLKEYRTRLIADVVTGKLDVREAAAALPDVDPLAADDEPDGTIDEGVEADLEEMDAIPVEDDP